MMMMFVSLHLWAFTFLCVCVSVSRFFFFLHPTWVFVCVLGVESLIQLSEFSPDWTQKESDRVNQHPADQQDKSIDHAAERDLRFVPSIMLNYAQPDADLVALIMPHNQPRVSHKQKIRVSYVPWEKKKRKKVSGWEQWWPLASSSYLAQSILCPLDQRRKQADYQSKCFQWCVGYRMNVRRDEELNRDYYFFNRRWNKMHFMRCFLCMNTFWTWITGCKKVNLHLQQLCLCHNLQAFEG